MCSIMLFILSEVIFNYCIEGRNSRSQALFLSNFAKCNVDACQIQVRLEKFHKILAFIKSSIIQRKTISYELDSVITELSFLMKYIL